MKEYRITWAQCPHAYHPKNVMFVEAETEEDARAIASNHIERRHAVGWFIIFDATEAPAVPAGRVREV